MSQTLRSDAERCDVDRFDVWSTCRWVWGQLHVSAARAVGAVLLGAVGALCGVALIGVSAWLIARASQMPGITALTMVVIGVRALGVSRGVFRYLERLVSHHVALTGLIRLRTNLFTALAQAPMARVSQLRRGRVVEQIGRDVDGVGDFLVRGLFPHAVAVIAGAVAVLSLAVISPVAAVWLIVGLVIGGGCSSALVMWSARRQLRDMSRHRADLTVLVESVAEHRDELELNGQLPGLTQRVERAESDLAAAQRAATRPLAWASALGFVGLAIAVLGAMTAPGPVRAAGPDSIWFAVSVLLPLAAMDVTSLLPTASADLVSGVQAAQRLRSFMDPVSDDQQAARGDQQGVQSASPETERGAGTHLSDAQAVAALSTAGLVVGWPDRPGLTLPDVTVRRGEVLVMVGASGCGKTSTLLTLAGLLPAQAGQVCVEAGRATHDMHTLPDPLARDVVCLVAEDAHIFGTTVTQNISLHAGAHSTRDATDALTAAGAASWVSSLPQGLDTVLASGGTNISGGQRRRLLLARGLLTSCPVLLLDEPTEHLDASSLDQLALQLVLGCARGRAIVIASHSAEFVALLQQHGPTHDVPVRVATFTDKALTLT